MGELTRQIMQETRDGFYKGEREAAAYGVALGRELAAANPHIDLDGKEFGMHVNGGGWRLGLLAARSVEVRDFRSGRHKAADPGNGEKVSVTAFGHISGVSPYLIDKHLTAWRLASEAGVYGIVPASELQPGAEIRFNAEDHSPKTWKKYFKQAARPPRVKSLLKEVNSRFNAVLGIEPADYRDRTLFEGRSDYSLKEVFDSNERWVRAAVQKGAQIRENLIAVAGEMGYEITYDDEDG